MENSKRNTAPNQHNGCGSMFDTSFSDARLNSLQLEKVIRLLSYYDANLEINAKC